MPLPSYTLPLGQAGYLLLESLSAFCILINGLLKKIRLLAITVLHAPIRQASYALARISKMFFTSPSMNYDKIKVSCHCRPTPPPKAGELSLDRIRICFLLILINELQKKLKFLAITVVHAPLRQATYPFAEIPICFSYSHQLIQEKAKVSCHYRPTLPPRAGGLSPA